MNADSHQNTHQNTHQNHHLNHQAMKTIFLTFLLIPTLVFSQVGTIQDTLNTKPYHLANPSVHKDTLYLQGYSVKHLVDSTGIAVFLYDPEQGIWQFDNDLSTGVID